MKIPPLKIHYSRKDRKEILRRVDEALAKGSVVMGKNVEELEQEFARYCGAKWAVAVSSGTSALEVVMRILAAGKNEVLLPANTFFSTASAVLFAGGRVRLVDISPETFSLTLRGLKKRITKRTTGVILVHIGGIISPEIEDIKNWCDEKGLWFVEDAAHAHGSDWNGRKAGTIGLAGCYSFFATKVMTCGEGGMIVTDDAEIAKKARLLRNHGKPEPWVSYHTHLGSNWRMSELAAAAGLVHLGNLDKFVAWRSKIASIYTKHLEDIPQLTPLLPAGRSSWYKYIVLPDRNINKAKLKALLKEKGVHLSGEVYEIPLHRQPALEGIISGEFPIADDVCARHFCLPLYYGMTNTEAMYVIDNLKIAIMKKEVMQ